MGWNSWATTEQLGYLESWIPQLPRTKETTTLKILYLQVHEGFLAKWQAPHPINPVAGMSLEQIVATAIEDLLEVRLKLSYFYLT